MPSNGLQYDPDEAAEVLCGTDRRLAKIIERVGPVSFDVTKLGNTFQALFRTIIYQQLSGKAAATIHGRACALFPRKRPTPGALLELTDEQIRSAGLSRAKAAAVRDLADRARSGLVPTAGRLARMTDDEILDTLTAIRGIGPWSVEMILMFRLGRPDVLPATDLGVQKGFAQIYRPRAKRNELPKPRELLEFGERWRPFRSAAAWYLWRALELP